MNAGVRLGAGKDGLNSIRPVQQAVVDRVEELSSKMRGAFQIEGRVVDLMPKP
jgi:hypothetical protein